MKYMNIYNRTVDLLNDNKRLETIAQYRGVLEDYPLDKSKRDSDEKKKLDEKLMQSDNLEYNKDKAGKSLHIKSNNYKKINSEENYTIYINTMLRNTDKMLRLMIEEFDKRELPYKIDAKFFDNSNIYQRTINGRINMDVPLENLPRYIEVFDKIGEENPDIKKNCANLPLLAGVIDNWLGITVSSTYLLNVEMVQKVFNEAMIGWFNTNESDNLDTYYKNPDFIEFFKNSLKIEAEVNNLVSPEKICFSNNTKELFMEQDASKTGTINSNTTAKQYIK